MGTPPMVEPMWRLVVGVLMVIVGGVWFGQGIGAIGGSFMSGQEIWAIIGGAAVIFGLALVWGEIRARRNKS